MTKRWIGTKSLSLMLGATISLACISPALAANMDVRFGNTVHATRPDGTEINLYFNADHTFTGKAEPANMPFGFSLAGTWRMDGGKLCVLQKTGRGKNLNIEKCDTLQGDKIDDTWTITVSDQDDKDVEQTMTIVEGR